MLLKIKNLRVKGNSKEILKDFNLEIEKGQVQALLGPNASGKSTLAQIILGNPKYKVVSGKIFFNGRDITRYSPERRVKMGLALSWQNPPEIKGVKLYQILKSFSGLSSELLDREVNVDFSGGEKKISELIQVLALKPKLVIFDEIDSGLDLNKTKEVAKIIKKELINKKITVFLITHSGEILKFLKPDLTNVMVNGQVICQGKNYQQVLKVIKKYGYEKCKKCQAQLLADK